MLIAKRSLAFLNNGSTSDIPIRLYAPQQWSNSWYCAYEIGWPEGVESMKAYGIDSVQAILQAMQMIGAELYTSSYHKEGRLVFGEAGTGYGFPVPTNIRDLLIGDDAKYC